MSEQPAAIGGKSVQDYIDETPVWADGTSLSSPLMTAMQWRIWGLAAAGKFFEGLVVFMTGVAMPLIAEEFNITPAQHGVVGAASLFGILVGAIGLGGLSDRFGRKYVHRRDGDLHPFPDVAYGQPELLLAGRLFVRGRGGAWLRLSYPDGVLHRVGLRQAN